ncbi:MAG: hypothetical protein MHPSP_002176 [Paramarteilia canceri]
MTAEADVKHRRNQLNFLNPTEGHPVSTILAQTDSPTLDASKIYEKDRMMPGYTGFIPKLQNLYGKSFSSGCFEALAQSEMEKKCAQATSETYTQKRLKLMRKWNDSSAEEFFQKGSNFRNGQIDNTNCWTLRNHCNEIYRVTEGQIPNYSGHVPGIKFKNGQTFFKSSFRN